MIGAFYIVAFFVIGIDGDFPLNDDWAYAEGVRHLLQGEGLIMPNVCAAGIAHVALGFVAAKLLGYSYVSLRICSFLVTILGAVAVFIAAASFRIPRMSAIFITLLYAANPLLLNIAFGFMSDSTALSLNMIFLACLLRGLAKKSLKTILLAFVVLALAVSVRQSALIFICLSPFCLSKRFGGGRAKFFVFSLALALPLFSAWACDQWLVACHLQSGSINRGYDLVRQAHACVVKQCLFSAPQMVLPTIIAIGQVLCYLALFCLPALVSLVPLIFWPKPNRAFRVKIVVVITALVLSVALIIVAYYHQTMPFSENILRFTTIGAQGLLGIIRPALAPKGRMIITVISFLFVVPLVVALLCVLQQVQKKTLVWQPAVITVCSTVCLAFLTLETLVRCADRYYLLALGPMLLAVGFYARKNRTNLVNPLTVVLLLGITCYSIAGNQEYLSSNRARWQAIAWLEKTGAKSAQIDGGYEYNILRDLSVYNSTYRGEAPRNNWRWWPIKGEVYLVSLSPVPGYKTIHAEPYFSLFDRKTRNIEVLEQISSGH